MKNSLKMLLKNIKSNYHFGSSEKGELTTPIIIPERKNQSDLLSLFEETQKNSEYLENSDVSFNFFSIGYMFNIDRLLNVAKNVRYTYNSRMIFKDEVPKTLLNAISTLKPRESIRLYFENIVKPKSSYDISINSYSDEETQKNFISFIYGYNKAHNSAFKTYKIMKEDYEQNQNIDYFLYYFWDLLSTELIELNVETKKLVQEYINV